MTRQEEIEKRKAQIAEEVKTSDNLEEIEKLNEEVDVLNDEIEQIKTHEEEEKGRQVLSLISEWPVRKVKAVLLWFLWTA